MLLDYLSTGAVIILTKVFMLLDYLSTGAVIILTNNYDKIKLS